MPARVTCPSMMLVTSVVTQRPNYGWRGGRSTHTDAPRLIGFPNSEAPFRGVSPPGRHWPSACFCRDRWQLDSATDETGRRTQGNGRMTPRGWIWLAVVMLSLLSGYRPVEGAVSVSIDPKSAVTVRVNGIRQFTATVSGATDGSVTWSLTPPPGVSPSVIGSIDANGTYTAPPSPLPGFASLTVTATSVA